MIDFEFEFQYAEAKLPILRQVGGGIPAGRCVVLCGGSGCGKSTLLRCINGLIPQFYEGELKGFCRLNGQDTAGMRIGEIGELAASVFQNPRSQFFTVNSSNEVAFWLCQDRHTVFSEFFQLPPKWGALIVLACRYKFKPARSTHIYLNLS